MKTAKQIIMYNMNRMILKVENKYYDITCADKSYATC
jgi:hypothetical protein